MGAPLSASEIHNALHDGYNHLQVQRSTSVLSTSTICLQETGHKEEELAASLRHESLYTISSSGHGFHLSHNNRRKSAWLTKRALIFSQRQLQKKPTRPLIHNSLRLRLRLARLFSIVPKTKKSRDEESILEGVISYVQGLQNQVKDIRTDITRLQSNIIKSDLKTTARSATVQTTFDTYSMINDVRLQASNKERFGYRNDSEVLQKKAEAEYDVHTNMLQALDVKEVSEKTFHIQVRCKREAAVLQRLTKTLESLPLPMDFHSANLNAVDDHFINNVFVKTRAPMKAEMLKQVILDAALQMLNTKIKHCSAVVDICK